MFKRMKDQLRSGHGRKLVWLIAALLLITAGLTVTARTWLSSGEVVAKSVPKPAPADTNPRAQAPQEERAVIRLLTSGFSPTELSDTSGPYRLVITRPSQDEEVVLQLKTESGELVQEIEMPSEKLNWTTLIELEAGSYTLTVANHPQWVCHLTVQ